MALSLKYEKISESSTQLVIENSTGVYDPSVNTGGFGDPNVERSSVNLGLIVTRKTSDGNVGLTVVRTTPSSSTVTNVTRWTATLDGGGYHKIGIFTAPTYNDLAVYNQYDIVYVEATDNFYYYTNTEPSIASAFTTSNGWAVLTDADILDKNTQDGEDGVYKTVVKDFLTYGVKACFGVKSGEYVEAAHCKDCLDGVIKENFIVLMYRVFAESTSAVGNYTKGQIILEKTEELCGDSSSSCGC